MITYTDADDVRQSFKNVRDALLEDGADISEVVDSLDLAISDFDDLIADYDRHCETLDGDISDQNDEIERLEDEISELKPNGVSVESYAAALLQSCTGQEPNLGEVLSLKDDLEELLTTKYNISKGSI